jgi:Fic family protein
MAGKPTLSLDDRITGLLQEFIGEVALAPAELHARIPDVSRPTLNRALAKLMVDGLIVSDGNGPTTKYRLKRPAITWSVQAREALESVLRPMGQKVPISYNPDFHLSYPINQNAFLGDDLAKALYSRSVETDQREPAGTYLRRLLEPLLIDMSWSSSKLEGNRYGLLDTKELFEQVEQGAQIEIDFDAQMLLNHKDAIQFIAEHAPIHGLSMQMVMEIHTRLMDGLLQNSHSLGAIRSRLVSIQGSSYSPNQFPVFLKENLAAILAEAALINNPVEAAFFLWVNIAYLQPFEDGNKRMSRLLANIPLLISNCAPLSFIGVSREDYANAMLAIYEKNDVSVARDLFTWAYRESIEHYRAVLKSTPPQNPTEVQWRDQIKLAVRDAVRLNIGPKKAIWGATEGLPVQNDAVLMGRLEELTRVALASVNLLNADRFWLSSQQVERWLRAASSRMPKGQR